MFRPGLAPGDLFSSLLRMKRKNRFCLGERWAAFRSLLANVSPEDIPELLLEKDLVILDVRTPAERDQDGLPGAVGMNYFDDDFIEKLLALDRDRPYLVYCRTGRRSLRVCTWMRNSGFDHLFHMDGGLLRYRESEKEQ